ncbi:MAG: BamA/TamA family outer membrane protein, partial [Methylobacteriaceae bacterium]|nr:BamA/TamA family outer membrane protein [Methylobacteriaceae bacterium]
AIKEAAGDRWTSMAGVTFNYSTLDNKKNPRSGWYIDVRPEVAGIGGDAKYFRIAGDVRYYHEINDDFVGMIRLQGGHIRAFGGEKLNILDHYFLGPSLVRGFAPSGIGPRDISNGDSRASAIGGTTYFGGTVEVQFPVFGLPKELGMKGAIFADAGTLFGYEGQTSFDLNKDGQINGIINGTAPCGSAPNTFTTAQECILVRDEKTIRSSVGASLLWESPLGPIRFDYAWALTKDKGVIVNGTRVGQDRTQAFRFSSGFGF